MTTATKQAKVSFVTSKHDWQVLHQIAGRAVAQLGIQKVIDWEMDVTAVHANGCPLRLDDLLMADGFNFAHDLCGIYRHLDRETGQLRDCFVPRYAKASS